MLTLSTITRINAYIIVMGCCVFNIYMLCYYIYKYTNYTR